jgi:CRISPR system Cascade subunit CasE
VISRPGSKDPARTQRYGHVTVTQQTDWLLQRASRNGFVISEGFDKQPDVIVRGRRSWKFTRQEHTVTLSTAVFEGRLEVAEPDALRSALTRGIGPAKGYGCGLLTLAPPR